MTAAAALGAVLRGPAFRAEAMGREATAAYRLLTAELALLTAEAMGLEAAEAAAPTTSPTCRHTKDRRFGDTSRYTRV